VNSSETDPPFGPKFVPKPPKKAIIAINVALKIKTLVVVVVVVVRGCFEERLRVVLVVLPPFLRIAFVVIAPPPLLYLNFFFLTSLSRAVLSVERVCVSAPFQTTRSKKCVVVVVVVVVVKKKRSKDLFVLLLPLRLRGERSLSLREQQLDGQQRTFRAWGRFVMCAYK